MMDSARRDEILRAYTARVQGFEQIASSRAQTTRLFLAAQTRANPQFEPEAAFEPEVRHLSGRERQVLSLLAQGLRNQEVGSRLGISAETVKSHVQRILRSLGARNRAHAVLLASQHGLLDPAAPGRLETTDNEATDGRSRHACQSPAVSQTDGPVRAA
jgi:DNA-binding NarL/FixJ family response regulator